MRTHEERKILLHRRAMELERDHTRAELRGSALASLMLVFSLIFAIGWFGGTDHALSSMSFAGTSLLGESAGGYVLTAVISFAAAVVITVLCIKKRK